MQFVPIVDGRAAHGALRQRDEEHAENARADEVRDHRIEEYHDRTVNTTCVVACYECPR